MSRATKKAGALSALFFVISAVTVLAPLVTFGILVYISNAKVIMIAMLAAALILFLVDLLRHAKVRASMWVIMLGIVLTADSTKMLVFVAVTTGCVLLDEYVFWPLHCRYRLKRKINKEIDARGA